MGCDSMTGQVALHRFVRPVSVLEFPDSVYFSRLLPKGVKATQRKKMTVKTKVTAKACAGLLNNTKNIINETKLATMPPLVPANIITTKANKAQNRNQGFFVSQRNRRLKSNNMPQAPESPIIAPNRPSSMKTGPGPINGFRTSMKTTIRVPQNVARNSL